MKLLSRILPQALLLAFAALPVHAQDSARRTTRDSVFSAAQAARGNGVFTRSCTQCHTREQFKGDAGFQKNWLGRSFYDVVEQISSTMPNDNPGALPRRDYVDVVIYLLTQVGYPTGASDLPLTESSLKSVMIVALPLTPAHFRASGAGRARPRSR